MPDTSSLAFPVLTHRRGAIADGTTYDEEEFMEWGAETSDDVQLTESIPQSTSPVLTSAS